MKRFVHIGLAVSLTFILLCSARSSSSRHATLVSPTRDYLTSQEVDLVKEAQVLDKRTDVFIKAAERRFQVLGVQIQITTIASTKQSQKQAQKEAELWGDLPQGTRAELITDIAGILDAAIENIDDVALRDEKNPLVPKSLRKLADAATLFQAQLEPMQEKTQDKTERLAIEQALQNVQEILEAAGKLQPAPLPTKK
jgi:acyl-CoA reductase-like NAD-dependent aldehyde dehydrogenase